MEVFRLFLLLAMFAAYALAAANGDDGIGVDPHGGRTTSSARCGDEGNGFDPHGGPCTSAQSDAGWGIDPNG